MNFKLYQLPKALRLSVSFLLALSFHLFFGLDMLKQTTDYNPTGIERNVLGNEFDESADELHFKMSERELHGIIHSHVISIGMILLVLTSLLYFSTYSTFKLFLMISHLFSDCHIWWALAFVVGSLLGQVRDHDFWNTNALIYFVDGTNSLEGIINRQVLRLL